jgi:hypothetical protein
VPRAPKPTSGRVLPVRPDATIPRAVLADTSLSPGAKCVYAALRLNWEAQWSHYRPEMHGPRLVQVHRDHIAQDTGIRPRTVSKHIQELINAGVIQRVESQWQEIQAGGWQGRRIRQQRAKGAPAQYILLM